MGGMSSTDERVSVDDASMSSPAAGGPTVGVKTDKSASAADLQKVANVVRLQWQAISSMGKRARLLAMCRMGQEYVIAGDIMRAKHA